MIHRKTLGTACLSSFLMLASLAACAPQPAVLVSPIATPLVASATPSQPIKEVPMPSSTLLPQSTVPAATRTPRPTVSELAVADLAGQLGIAADAITVRSVEAVEWSDGSLGCPKPGMMYAQVITPGYRIVLEANGQSYEYHTGRSSTVIRCKP